MRIPEGCGQQRMLTTALRMRERQFQMTTLRQIQQQRMITTAQQLRERQMRMTALQQMQPRMPMPIPQQRVLVPPFQQTRMMTPFQRQTPYMQPLPQMPQYYTGLRTPAQPRMPIQTPAALITPVTKAVHPKLQKPLPPVPTKPTESVTRTPEERVQYCEAALQRGLVAEGDGNYRYARACYKTALSYPETPAARLAEKTLRRVETILEQHPEYAVAVREPEPFTRPAPTDAKPVASKQPASEPQRATPVYATPTQATATQASRQDLYRHFHATRTPATLTLQTGISAP